jgi:hypothetical protein
MLKKVLSLLIVSSIAFCGEPTYSNIYTPPSSSIDKVLKSAKGKDKEIHKISGIDFIYTITAKKCHRFNDLKRSFGKFNVCPYRFTSISPSNISSKTMYRSCLRGSRRLHRVIGQKMVKKKRKLILARKHMEDYSSGYIHKKMSIKKLASALSHISCIKDALDSGYETIWIMDSGTELRCDPNILSKYIERANKEIPDWTSLYTDYSERGRLDDLETIGNFYYRPDFDFLETEDYLSREEEDSEDDSYFEDDNSNNESSNVNTLGRLENWKYMEARERLICEKWNQNHPDEGNNGDGATGPSDNPGGSNNSYEQQSKKPPRARIKFIVKNKRTTAFDIGNSASIEKFSHVGLLKGAHSYILNRKGMKLILEWYQDHKIFIPYAQEIQIIPGMHPYCVPDPVTRNQNKG